MQPDLLKIAEREYENGYYEKKLKEGQEYQDHITKELYKRGIVIVNYGSKLFQQKEGENIIGAEIKRDGNFRDTGNLYIEVAEKANPKNTNYVSSGIYRSDNSWLFIIGDEKKVWIFTIVMLRLLHRSKDRFKNVKTATSIGFLLPINDAGKYAAKIIDIA